MRHLLVGGLVVAFIGPLAFSASGAETELPLANPFAVESSQVLEQSYIEFNFDDLEDNLAQGVFHLPRGENSIAVPIERSPLLASGFSEKRMNADGTIEAINEGAISAYWLDESRPSLVREVSVVLDRAAGALVGTVQVGAERAHFFGHSPSAPKVVVTVVWFATADNMAQRNAEQTASEEPIHTETMILYSDLYAQADPTWSARVINGWNLALKEWRDTLRIHISLQAVVNDWTAKYYHEPVDCGTVLFHFGRFLTNSGWGAVKSHTHMLGSGAELTTCAGIAVAKARFNTVSARDVVAVIDKVKWDSYNPMDPDHVAALVSHEHGHINGEDSHPTEYRCSWAPFGSCFGKSFNVMASQETSPDFHFEDTDLWFTDYYEVDPQYPGSVDKIWEWSWGQGQI